MQALPRGRARVHRRGPQAAHCAQVRFSRALAGAALTPRSKREYLLALIRQKDRTISSLLTQIQGGGDAPAGAGMDGEVEQALEEILDEVEESHGTPHAEQAARFEEHARALPHGAVGRAAWFAHAGEAWELEGDPGRARTMYEEAVADGGVEEAVLAAADEVGADDDRGGDGEEEDEGRCAGGGCLGQ